MRSLPPSAAAASSIAFFSGATLAHPTEHDDRQKGEALFHEALLLVTRQYTTVRSRPSGGWTSGRVGQIGLVGRRPAGKDDAGRAGKAD